MIGSARNKYAATYSFSGSLLSEEKYRMKIETKNGKRCAGIIVPNDA